MRKVLFALAAVALSSCAEIDTTSTVEETVTMGSAITIEADDGTEFEVAIVHDGSLTPAEEAAVVGSIGVVVVANPYASGIRPVRTRPEFVLPVNPTLVPGNYPVSVLVTGVDPDAVLGNYRWDWLEGIDEEQIESFVEDLCPPWH